MKILFVPSDNNATSGAFLSMVKLCEILKKQYDCEICVLLHCNGNGEALLDENHIPYKKIYSLNWFIPYKPRTFVRKVKRFLCNFWMPIAFLYNRVAVSRICRLIESEKFDLVHINTSCTYVGAVAAQKMKIPFVWHIREFLEEDQERCIWKKENAYKLMAQSDRVIAISNSIYDKYKKCLDSPNIIQIYNGIDADLFYTGDHELFTDDKIHMVIVGSINESKGQNQVIYACKALLDDGWTDFEVKIAGKESEYSSHLQKLTDEMGLSDYVKFVGPQKDVAKLYKEADITLMCSAAEAFGRVTVEAMMSGSLVIGANSGGTLELIEDECTGLLYESGNIDNLACRIKYAVENKTKMKIIAKKGQEKMMTSMTAASNASNIYELYKNVLK